MSVFNGPVHLRKGLGKVVSACTREFAPKDYQGRNLINMKKSAEADFYLNVPQSGTYRIEDISCETYRAEGISRAEGTKKRCPER